MVDLNQATPADRPARRRARWKFIHAADLHIDSPLRGLESYDGAPLDQLRGATRSALQNLVDFAVREAVDFIIIAGDLFDGKWQDVRTGLWTAARLRELDRAGIRVFLLQGNHDAASKVRQAIQWPGNTHVFSVDRPETIRLDDMRVALHGQGFAQEQVNDDLAAGYPEPLAGYFNIGVLHSSLTGNPLHDTYAPTSIATLVARAYDYWALGHVHARSEPPLHRDPYITYCGNLQGRHIRETGAKGCLVVGVEDGQLQAVEFRAMDTLRWSRVEVTLESHHTRAELLDAVRDRLLAARGGAEGRLLAVRVIVQGACAAHRELVREGEQHQLVAEIRNLASELAEDIWIEKVVLDTRPPVDMDALRRGSDLLAELLVSMQQLREDPALPDLVQRYLQPLQDKAALELHEAGVALDDAQQLVHWLQQAEALLVSRLTELEP